MRAGAAIVQLALLASCGVTEGRLLHAVDAGGGAADAGDARDGDALDGSANAPLELPDAARPSGSVWQELAWQYQLVGDVDADLPVQLFVIDLFEAPDELLEQLRADGKIAIAYISAGTFEPWRDDAEQFPQAVIGNPLEAYPDESWLDVRDQTVRARMAARLDLARRRGFGGVLPTNLTGYQRDSGFPLSASDQNDYNAWFSEQAHQRGLHVGMSGDFGRLAELGGYFDWAVQFGCIARQDCDRLDPFAAAGKPVLNVETSGDPQQVCARAAEYGVNTILKRDGFDAYRVGCK